MRKTTIGPCTVLTRVRETLNLTPAETACLSGVINRITNGGMQCWVQEIQGALSFIDCGHHITFVEHTNTPQISIIKITPTYA